MKRILLALVVLLPQTSCVLFSNNTMPATTSIASDTIIGDTIIVAEKPCLSDLEESHRDINADGVVDSVFFGRSGGSGTGGYFVHIVDGKTQKSYDANNVDYWEAVVKICTIDIKDRAYAAIAKELLLPSEKRHVLDPVAQWVVNSLKKRELINGEIFSAVSKPKLSWQQNLGTPKAAYCVRVSSKQARQIAICRDDAFIEPGDSTWLVVDCIYQSKLTQVLQDDGVKVFSNGYCVGIERNEQFAWVFVNDYFWTGVHSRGAIDSIIVRNGVMWIEVSLNTFLVDINTGKLVLLNGFPNFDDKESFDSFEYEGFKDYKWQKTLREFHKL